MSPNYGLQQRARKMLVPNTTFRHSTIAMSSWTDPARWVELVSGAGCPICRDGGPTHRLIGLETSTLAFPPGGPLRGYAVLFSRRHVVEFHDLEEVEGAAFMRDLQRVSRALLSVTGAIKLNYEIHGNTIPHLHVHLYPRYRSDPFEGRPIDPRGGPDALYAPGEHEGLAEQLQAQLRAPGVP